MAYNKKKIPETTNDISTMGIGECLQYFTKESQFKDEKQMVQNLLIVLEDLIKKIYQLDLEDVELEKTFNLKKYDLPSVRAYIYCRTKQGVDLCIECKNPTNNYGELNLSLAQMINYQMIIEAREEHVTKLILATSRFHFYMAKTMKRFGLNFDVILHNQKTTAFLLNSEL